MNASDIDIDSIQVASPCPASWRKMKGDSTVRHCEECNLNVYDFSNLNRAEIKQLIVKNEGTRLCVRLHKREDGTLITRDCPVGVRSLQRRKLAWVSAGCFAFVALVGFVSRIDPERRRQPDEFVRNVTEKLRDVPVLGAIVEKIFPEPEPVILMGAMPSPRTPGPTIGKLPGP
jgi:hypothetical protein